MNSDIYNKAIATLKTGIYKKNIYFCFKPGADPEEFALVKAFGASPAMVSWMVQQAHCKVGAQMQVAKAVSDTLLASDFTHAARVEDVVFPAAVAEMYFEDPMLPSITVMKGNQQLVQELFPQLDAPNKLEFIAAVMQEGSDIMTSKLLSLQLKPDMYSELLDHGRTERMNTGIFSSDLTDDDTCAMSFMLHLVLKVFVFASIPIYKPTPITKKQMVYGGKPHVKGRPVRPAFHVTYLPRIIRPVTHATGLLREFRGRRGHIHFYRHTRFVNRKGTWDIIAPVKDPKTGQYPTLNILKVRQPKQSQS